MLFLGLTAVAHVHITHEVYDSRRNDIAFRLTSCVATFAKDVNILSHKAQLLSKIEPKSGSIDFRLTGDLPSPNIHYDILHKCDLQQTAYRLQLKAGDCKLQVATPFLESSDGSHGFCNPLLSGAPSMLDATYQRQLGSTAFASLWDFQSRVLRIALERPLGEHAKLEVEMESEAEDASLRDWRRSRSIALRRMWRGQHGSFEAKIANQGLRAELSALCDIGGSAVLAPGRTLKASLHSRACRTRQSGTFNGGLSAQFTDSRTERSATWIARLSTPWQGKPTATLARQWSF